MQLKTERKIYIFTSFYLLFQFHLFSFISNGIYMYIFKKEKNYINKQQFVINNNIFFLYYVFSCYFYYNKIEYKFIASDLLTNKFIRKNKKFVLNSNNQTDRQLDII